MLRARRNQPGGYWIAKDDPSVAHQAVTGGIPVRDLLGAAVLSNGASRIVSSYGLAGWHDILHMLRTNGPAEIIGRLRNAEASRTANGQAPDDATIAYCTGLGSVV
jgi:hypothetical protein